MYNFSYFKEKDQQVILDFLEEYPFAFLTGSFLSGKQVVTQIPVLVEQREGELFLQGHMMRNTDHHKALVENPNALIVFTGPSCYVSASWYTNPHIGSTWNYMSVHAEGQLEWMSEEDLVAFMQKLTFKFEKGNPDSPTFYDNLPAHFLDKMMPLIAGFELKVDKLQNVFKLSQNRDPESYDRIIAQLEAGEGTAPMVAREMRRRRTALFPPGQEWDGSRFDS